MAKRELKKVNTEVEETKVETEEDSGVQAAPALIGVVTNCSKLNIRKSPDLKSEVVTQVNVKSELGIISDKKKDWYQVSVIPGVEGYCMKKYITLK